MTKVLAVLCVCFFIFMAAGCNLTKYDTYNECVLTDGKYEITVSIRHDSSETTEKVPLQTYGRLCTDLVGGPNVHISRPKK